MRIDIQNAVLLILCLVLLLGVFSLSANAAGTDEFLLGDIVVYETPITIGNFTISSDSTGYVGFFYSTDGQGDIWYRILSLANTTFHPSNGFVINSNLQSGEYYCSDGILFTGIRVEDFPDDFALNSYISNIEWPNVVGSNTLVSSNVPSYASFEYSLPPGNVAYIPIPTGHSSAINYTLTTSYYMAFGNNDTSRINQVVTVMSELPSSSNNVAPSSPKIPWTNNGNVNLFGVSANKIYQGSIPANYGGQYLVVVNPMTMPSQSGLIGGDTFTNGSINITVSAVSGSPHIYPMSESLTITPGDGIGSESSFGDTGYTYVVDPETGEIIWTDPSGGNSAPVAGGNNPMPTPNTIFDWLRNISQQLADFLRGPVQAVQVVISAIREFMGSFTQLYQWLPSPVYSLITSALMIALTIGVIKIFV